LQPFDISVASPIKTVFQKWFMKITGPTIEKLINGTNYFSQKQTAENLRIAMVNAFINAMHHAATPANIIVCFSAAGIVPLDSNINKLNTTSGSNKVHLLYITLGV
jgi:hypothetical protein